ncbi:PP2C family protein-serine/threonine phosphatase [candidate division CSSED10-310 bacterium]|uniref:PP2C family protein-serine/threonine phosphatase n=1 Tax=candidate division CSSED10-310 bacterium TaxID=2855610 RepID=A0ABV6Z2P3_UNCC1
MHGLGVGQTDRGRKRNNNEDYMFIDNELGLYIVSDGMGGHAAGEVASKSAVNSVVRQIKSQRPLLDRVKNKIEGISKVVRLAEKALVEACNDVYQLAKSKQNLAGMGSTLTLFLIVDEKAVMAHVGDTRLYLLRAGEVHLLSNDHTMAAEMVRKGIISLEESRGHRMSNVLTRTVGTHEAVQVDTLLIDIFPEDRFLLCSDGLSE